MREFVIEKGSSITTIGGNLFEQKLIRNKGIFKYIIQFQGLTAKIQYGSYPLSSSMDVNQIISVLTSGTATTERTITIIPGWTVEDIAGLPGQAGRAEGRQGIPVPVQTTPTSLKTTSARCRTR